ncbi:DNA-directed RNA polymerase subunit beta [Gorillibacterium timonense]|uniref:DNA-directed RNA polymerase subunit beta n=1 Tax=Gorillibacterium timonense TaxID=1689269 RepID=UPI00071C4710|nr:DNA-directed RNA polymerase subunit beta [Gorillibacterium timonense]
MPLNEDGQASAAKSREAGLKPASGKKAEQPTKPSKSSKSRKKKRLKLWIRISIPFLCLIALVVGMGVGYVYMGKQPMSDIWKWETWRHAFDLIFAP